MTEMELFSPAMKDLIGFDLKWNSLEGGSSSCPLHLRAWFALDDFMVKDIKPGYYENSGDYKNHRWWLKSMQGEEGGFTIGIKYARLSLDITNGYVVDPRAPSGTDLPHSKRVDQKGGNIGFQLWGVGITFPRDKHIDETSEPNQLSDTSGPHQAPSWWFGSKSKSALPLKQNISASAVGELRRNETPLRIKADVFVEPLDVHVESAENKGLPFPEWLRKTFTHHLVQGYVSEVITKDCVGVAAPD